METNQIESQETVSRLTIKDYVHYSSRFQGPMEPIRELAIFSY